MPIFDRLDKNRTRWDMENVDRRVKMDLERQTAILNKLMDMLDEVRSRILNIQGRLSVLEKTVEKRLQSNLLTEKKFLEEVQGSDEMVERILNEVKGLVGTKSAREIVKEKPFVERPRSNDRPSAAELERIERIKTLLQEHNKISSSQLSQLMELSRNRCNEYFKKMENMGIVKPVIVGKEKFYTLG